MTSTFLIKKSLETVLNIYELDATGVLHVHTKSIPITMEVIEENQKQLVDFLEGEKVKMLVNSTDSQTLTSEMREIVNKDIKETCSAMALMASSTVGMLVTKVFMCLISKPVPMKLFSNKQDALRWLRDLDTEKNKNSSVLN